ncbi:MAG: response regulator [Rhodocyclaceae bacterium]|nr:response regulator [Rhodocyclaceae bacterium]
MTDSPLIVGGHAGGLPGAVAAGEAERHILLVDDEESILSAMKRLLRRDGYCIYTARSGQEGLELLASTPIGVIVSDQRMPTMSGAEFLGEVKRRYPDTMRIVLSGYTELNSITDAINKGAIYKFLTKPWDDDLLRAHIREAFEVFEMRSANRRLQMLNRAIVDAVPDAILLVDVSSGRIVTANRATTELLGYDHAALAGMAIAEIETLPLDWSYWQEISGGDFRPLNGVETEYRMNSGALLPVRKSTSCIDTDSGRQVVMVVHDLQMERAFEATMALLNTELSSILEASPQGLLVLNQDRSLYRLNRRLDALFDMPESVVESGDGECLLEYISRGAEDPDATLAALRAALAVTDTAVHGEFARRSGDQVRWYANPRVTPDGSTGHVLGFIVDVGNGRAVPD